MTSPPDVAEAPERPSDPKGDALAGPQLEAEDIPVSRTFATPLLSFDGISYTSVNPPDTVGDVGPNHYIQMVNGPGGSQFAIYNKDGVRLAGPTELDSLWTAGGPCAFGRGDPIVLYDRAADRWLMSEFANPSFGNRLCVYISRTGNPLSGGWFTYAFATTIFPDFPKYGVWRDGYYISTNECTTTCTPAVYALERQRMLNGEPAAYQRFSAPRLAGFGFQALTPSHVEGSTLPPVGAPFYFMRHRDDEVHNSGSSNSSRDFLEIWELRVFFGLPTFSALTGPTNIPVAEFDSRLCGLTSLSCFPQPGTSVSLDPLREVIMFPLHYMNHGTHESLVGNFVTDVNGADRGGIRWFELRKRGSAGWRLHQEGTYTPDANNRWIGSIAMDKEGNIALGYNVSSSTVFPSIRYTGRFAADPLGQMPRGEVTLMAGGGSSPSNRWGDYSAMGLDPSDDCTFWFTSEYVPAGGLWRTRIGAFRLPGCGVVPNLIINDVTVSEGHSGTRDATFTLSLSQPKGAPVPVEWETVDGTALGTQYSNSTEIVIPSQNTIATIASPYPSTIVVPEGTGTVTNVTVVLKGFTIARPGDVDVLLVGPAGQMATVMSDIACPGDVGPCNIPPGSSLAVEDVTLTIDDGAPTLIPTVPPSGTYYPTDREYPYSVIDRYPSPGPGNYLSGASLSVFNGTVAAGTWRLYVVGDGWNGLSGRFSGGWSLILRTTETDYVFTSATTTIPADSASQTLSVPVIGNTIREVPAAATFSVRLLSALGSSIVDGEGIGTIVDDDFTDPSLPGVPVTTTHITELRTLINELRAIRGLEAFTFTEALTPGTTNIRALHVAELRTALNAVYTAAGQPVPSYTDPVLTAGVTFIRAIHIAEIREKAVNAP